MPLKLPINRASTDVYDTVEMLVSLLVHVRDHLRLNDDGTPEVPSCIEAIDRVVSAVGLTAPEWGSPEAWWSLPVPVEPTPDA